MSFPNRSSTLVPVHWPNIWWADSKGAANQSASRVQNRQTHKTTKNTIVILTNDSILMNDSIKDKCQSEIIEQTFDFSGRYPEITVRYLSVIAVISHWALEPSRLCMDIILIFDDSYSKWLTFATFLNQNLNSTFSYFKLRERNSKYWTRKRTNRYSICIWTVNSEYLWQ